MTHEQDPPRLLQTLDAELSELLPGLQRARAQGPSDEQLARLCAGVAVAVRAKPATTESGTLGEPELTDTTSPTSGSVTRTSASGTGAAKLLKLLLAGALIGGAVLYGLRAQKRVPADRTDRPTRPVAAAPQAQAVAPATPRMQAPPTVGALPEPQRVERAQARNAAGASASRRAPPAAETSASDVDAELALLKRARAEVRPDPARALALTAEHAARFAHGALAEEREVIAIEALLVRHQRAGAQARARAFFADYPASAHGRRVRTLLAEHDAVLSDENPSLPPHPSH